MTEPGTGAKKARRLRARRIMEALTAVCVLAALVPGAQQLVSSGWAGFLSRPPGVGATAPDQAPSGVARAPAPPGINLVQPPPVAEALLPAAQPPRSAVAAGSKPLPPVAHPQYAAKGATFQSRSSSNSSCLGRTWYRH